MKRLQKEVKTFQHECPEVCRGGPVSSEMKEWRVQLFGPKDSPYEGGTFQLSINFPQKYPFEPPQVVFLTPIYHPNISEEGRICLDILSTQWTPALTISKVLLSLSSLLTDPNPNDPLRSDASNMYKTDYNEYVNKVGEYVKKYASTTSTSAQLIDQTIQI